MNKFIKELMDTVVSGDYCIGCGICASLEKSPLSMRLDENGKYKPFVNQRYKNDEMNVNVLAICPFSNTSKNETEVGNEIFNQSNRLAFNQYIGYYIKNYAGFVKEGDYRKKGSSGGMGTWVAAQLLKQNLVDGIIHVKSNDQNNILFEYQISTNDDDLLKGAKSRYYPVEMSKVIEFVKKNEGRYALVGVPCFIKSIRLLCDQDSEIKDRIQFCIGLVCGHLKSDMFAKSIGWELGIEPRELQRIDFRKKLENRSASDYGVEVIGHKDGELVTVSKPTRELYTSNWGYGLFKYNACEYCDDVLGETADVTVGDAWLPEYVNSGLGTNIIIVRNPIIQGIIEDNKDKIHIEEISEDKIYQSQLSGIRHRREGLSYRLYLKDMEGEWRPIKRTEPNNKINKKRKKVYRSRTKLSEESFKAFKNAQVVGEFKGFIDYMNPLIKDYNKVLYPTKIGRVFTKVKGKITRILKYI